VITLGVDVGTTRIKVLALDVASGRTLALGAAETPVKRDTQGEAHRPAEVLETVIALLTEVTRSLEHPAQVAALCCASVGEEVVLLDGDDRPVADAIAWYDPRGTAEAEAFLAGPGASLRLTQDVPPDATFSIFKLLWIRGHQPADLVPARSWTDLGDFVLLGLGGDLVMDWSHASRAGAFDPWARAWDRDTIATTGLDVAFPPLVASGTVIGTLAPDVAKRTGLPPGVCIVSGGHDHLCAAFGAGLRTPSDLFLSAGTSEAHLALLAAPLAGQAGHGGRYHLDQGCFIDRESYYAHVNIHAGHVFRQWRSLLYEGVDDAAMYAELDAAAGDEDAPTFDLLNDLRHGRLDELPYTAGRAAIMRAVLVGLARRSADVVAQLESDVGHRFERILAVGLPTTVPLWRSLRASAYARPLVIVDQPETAAFGAALLAARAVAGDAGSHLAAPRTVLQPPRSRGRT
jgi:sugar (pentulose or hexulose) kinase